MACKGSLEAQGFVFIAALLSLVPKLAAARAQPISNAQILKVEALHREFRVEVKRLDQGIDDLSGKINYLFALFVAMLALFGTGVGFLINISRKLGPLEAGGIVGDEKKKIAEIELRLQRLEEALRSTRG